MAMETLTFSVEGMTCDHCVRAVTEALNAIEGVQDVDVSLQEKSATVAFNNVRTNREALQSVIEDEGYSASIQV